tara:strand:+ start:3321 stop:3923 length:603 start_codon:yes stop_codon:yes gene_type:complete
MKFLAIKFLIIFTLLSCNSLCAHRLQCIESWIDKNYLLDENKVINIDAYVSVNNSESFSVNILLDKKLRKVKINFKNQILFFEDDKSAKVFTDTNQLFIDKPDLNIIEIIFSIFTESSLSFFQNHKFNFDNNNYSIRNFYDLENLSLLYNDDCSEINHLRFKKKEFNVYIDKINFSLLAQDKSYFDFEENYYIYDLRHEN